MLDEQSGWHPVCWKCGVMVPVLFWNPLPPLSGRGFDPFKLAGVWPAKCHLCCDARISLFTDLATKTLVTCLWNLLIQLLFQKILDQKIWLLLVLLILVTVDVSVCSFVLRVKDTWIFPLFSLIFPYLVTVKLSPWKGQRRIAAAWLWEITLAGSLWKNTVCWLVVI